ncbi:MAG: Uma2 family endonuclease [Leptospira sp.]|nr:Uma2 family endonuclease [Leptospira sp.]
MRSEQPLSINASEPEPDLSIVKGNRDDFINQHPQTAELIIAIAVSSLSIDKEKAKIYAEANIPFYWIVDANRRGIFQYSEISEGRYLSETFFAFEDNIDFQSAGVAVKEFFPKTVS